LLISSQKLFGIANVVIRSLDFALIDLCPNWFLLLLTRIQTNNGGRLLHSPL
jgi:hypothetical protein